ncbi:hypothetical protein PIB30_091555 [Stylosanthes scabra]|uniref:Uncharacterized protein n=1 Tax=Stylosanthes scabra TaxID=79078 RepID=A0ABU6ZT84_9FABA|nr:hypothetical protein [Stylosanthes scabra]
MEGSHTGGCGHGIGMRLEILKHGLGEQGDRVDVTLNVTWVYGWRIPKGVDVTLNVTWVHGGKGELVF